MPPLPRRNSSVSLLMLENFPNNIMDLTATLLRLIGYEAACVYTSAEALERVQQQAVDCVYIIVNNVRDTNPFELMIAMRGKHPLCGFVLTSGDAADAERFRHYYDLGERFELIGIPVSPPILAQAIEKSLPEELRDSEFLRKLAKG